MAGLTSGKKILLKTMAAASEYSWKSMNSIAVPSHPDTAALVRSRVVRGTGPCGGASTLLIIDAFLALRSLDVSRFTYIQVLRAKACQHLTSTRRRAQG